MSKHLKQIIIPLEDGKTETIDLITPADLDGIRFNIDKHLQNTTNGLNHIPAGGHERQILAWEADGKAKWDDLANMFTGLEELLAYGVEWDVTVADPHITRIGNMSLHKTLPIQSLLKGCIAQGDKIIYWLDEDNWKYKKGGNPDKGETEQLARLDGYDGTVRVYCPSFYIKSKIIGDKRQVWLSTVKIDNTWTYQPEILIDAYRSTVLNTVPEDMGYLSTLPVNSAISVVNTATYCRGGDNRTAYDKYLTGADETEIDIFRSDLGKPRTNMQRATMRNYSRNAVSEMLSYNLYKNIFYWLYVVEYANFNCQEAFNATLTEEGYHQGGMGDGVTTLDRWYAYNSYNPIIPCGYGNDLGNGTGLKTIVIPSFMDGETEVPGITFKMPRWRGFDNPFGDIWTNLDGIVIQGDTASGLSKVYVTDDPVEYSDVIGNKEVAGIECPGKGYIKLFDLGETAEIIPSVNDAGASTTQYKCDYHMNTSFIYLRTLHVGGGLYHGGNAGLSSFNSYYGVSDSSSDTGFRSVSSFVSFSDNEG